MQNIKIPIHNRSIEPRVKTIPNWKISDQDKKDLLNFLSDLEMGKVNRGQKISESRRLKYLDMLKIPLTYFNKPTIKLTLKDVEGFEKHLDKTKYSPSTKSSVRLMLRVYMKWKLGEEKANKLTYFFDTRVPTKTPEYLSEQEVEKLYKGCKSAEERFLIAVLFDAGCRAEEFHNIRKEDVQFPKDKENYVKITFKEEYSKTQGRTISLYWKHSLEAVKDYLSERINIKSNDVLFEKRYDNIRQFLKKLGRKVLKKPIHYHLFRHSSATYYSDKLNRQQLCYRYGWKFSSNMVDVYISRAGMENKELDEKFQNTDLSDLKIKLEKETQIKNIEIEKLKEESETLKKENKTFHQELAGATIKFKKMVEDLVVDVNKLKTKRTSKKE